MFDFLSGPTLIGVIVGFAAGALGYIIVRFWIRPIGHYTRLKKQIADQSEIYLRILADDAVPKKNGKQAQTALRRLSAALSDSFQYDLPPWYRMLLKNRGETPMDASVVLAKLSNTRHAGHAAGHIEQVRQMLGRKPSNP